MKRMAILGIGRSGTSFVTEFIGKCGVFLDEVNWAHEHEFARLINDTILEREYGAKSGLPYGKLPAEEIKLEDHWHRSAQFFIQYMDLKAESNETIYWAFKDPRTTILHDIWIENFDIIIGVFRNPVEVVNSYCGHGWIKGFAKKRIALNYWKRFNRSMLHLYEKFHGKKAFYVLEYDEYIWQQILLLCKKLNLEVSESANAVYNPSLKQYHNTSLPADKEAIKLYQTLQSITISE